MNWLKRQIARWAAADELAELDRWRSTTDEYWRWLAEFYPIALTLENLSETVEGKRPLNICRPRGDRPWDVVNLREELRALQSTQRNGDAETHLRAVTHEWWSAGRQHAIPDEPDLNRAIEKASNWLHKIDAIRATRAKE